MFRLKRKHWFASLILFSKVNNMFVRWLDPVCIDVAKTKLIVEVTQTIHQLTQHLVRPSLSAPPMPVSVAVLAEISLRSPRKTLIFIIENYLYRINVFKNKLSWFWKNLHCLQCFGILSWSCLSCRFYRTQNVLNKQSRLICVLRFLSMYRINQYLDGCIVGTYR